MAAEQVQFRWATVIGVLAICVGLNYLPVFMGHVPFPQDLLLRHAAWDTVPHTPPRRGPEVVDTIALFYPFHAFIGKTERAGELPLWNPYIQAGAPLQADAQGGVFYPLNIIYTVLPAPWAWTIAFAARMFFAALFMALLIRSIGASMAGAITSGILFASCGFMTVWRSDAISDGAMWLPMVCYAVFRLRRHRSAGSISLAAIAFAMPALAGHPETAAHVTLIGCFLALLQPLDRRFAGLFVLAGVLAVGLAAVQILPTLEWVAGLKQNLDVSQPALTRHDGQGFFSRDILTSPSSALIPIPEGASYVGILALIAAPFALFQRPRRDAIFFAVIAALGIAVAFSIQPFHWIVEHLPLVKAWKNARLILAADFGIAALAGLGITELERKIPPTKVAWTVVGLMTVIVLAGTIEVHRATLTDVPLMRGPAGSIVFLAAALAVVGLRIRGKLQARAFLLTVLCLAAVEMISFSYGFPGFAKTSEVFPPAPVFEFLQRQGAPYTFRIAKTGYPIPANSGMMYGIQMAEGYDLTTERVRQFTEGLRENRDDGVFFLGDGIANTPDRRFDLLNVKYVIVEKPGADFESFSNQPKRFRAVYSEPRLAVFENRQVLPRAFAVPRTGVELIADPAAQLKRIREADFDPRKSVILSEVPSGIEGQEEQLDSKVEVVSSTNNSVTVHTVGSSGSVLVLSQMIYPGWRATIDEHEAQILTADFALCGVALPTGIHEVRFEFEPRTFRVGAALSLVSLGVIGSMGVWSKRAPVV